MLLLLLRKPMLLYHLHRQEDFTWKFYWPKTFNKFIIYWNKVNMTPNLSTTPTLHHYDMIVALEIQLIKLPYLKYVILTLYNVTPPKGLIEDLRFIE